MCVGGEGAGETGCWRREGPVLGVSPVLYLCGRTERLAGLFLVLGDMLGEAIF